MLVGRIGERFREVAKKFDAVEKPGSSLLDLAKPAGVGGWLRGACRFGRIRYSFANAGFINRAK